MGGKVLTYPAKESYYEGKKEGIDEVSFVFDQLLRTGRMDDMQRAVKDRSYLDGLVQEYYKKPTS